MFKDIWVTIVGLLSVLYLLNPSAGLFEIIPDAIPLVGNLDEATAAALLLAVLRYFGIDLTGFLRSTLKHGEDDKKSDS